MINTILIVDDKKLNIDMLTNILRHQYTIMAATSGESAIDLMEHRVPDLVLLDLLMPGIDGFGVLQHMKSRLALANIPVIFITGEHDPLAEEKGLSLGAVDYIKKPYNATVISVKVRNHLELKAYRDNLETVVRERTKELAASREAIIMGMSMMSEIHDKVTGNHIERIKTLTEMLAKKMMQMYPELIDQELVDAITLYSPLHDVGKIGISDNILKKTDVLTDDEYITIQMHTRAGAELLRRTENFLMGDKVHDLNVAIAIAEGHHERYDGTGYPYGLQGDSIPLPARIVALADVYDALRSPRPYKKALTHEETADIILNGDGRTEPSHFDPKVLEVFKQVHKELDETFADSYSNPA